MKVKISKSEFKDALRKVVSAADKKGSIPILANVLLVAQDGYVTATATDLEIGISVRIRADVERPGKTTVNAFKLAKISSSALSDSIELELKENTLHVSAGRAHFSLLTIEPDEFPNINAVSSENEFELSSSDLDNAIRKVAYATGKDEYRYYLMGVLIRSIDSENKVHFVATDAHRLALYEADAEAFGISAIVPRRTMAELKKFLKGSDRVKVSVSSEKSGSQIFFSTDDSVLFSSLIEGDFPDYMSVIPEASPVKATFDRQELLLALKEVSVVYDKLDTSPVIFEFGGSVAKIFASKKAEGGVSAEEAQVEVPLEFDGQELKVAFNLKHLLEGLSSFDSSSVTLNMATDTSPVLINSEEEPRLKCVIMPMRT